MKISFATSFVPWTRKRFFLFYSKHSNTCGKDNWFKILKFNILLSWYSSVLLSLKCDYDESKENISPENCLIRLFSKTYFTSIISNHNFIRNFFFEILTWLFNLKWCDNYKNVFKYTGKRIFSLMKLRFSDRTGHFLFSANYLLQILSLAKHFFLMFFFLIVIKCCFCPF